MSTEIDELRKSVGALQADIGALSQRFDGFQLTLATMLAPITAQGKSTEECIKQGFQLLQTCLQPSTLRWLFAILLLAVGGGPVSMLLASRLADSVLPPAASSSSSTVNVAAPAPAEPPRADP